MPVVKPEDDPIARMAATEIRRLFGHRVKDILLFGSRARGDARGDSDYDIAVFLSGQTVADEDTLVDLAWALQKNTGQILSFQVFPPVAEASPTFFLSMVKSEGVGL